MQAERTSQRPLSCFPCEVLEGKRADTKLVAVVGDSKSDRSTFRDLGLKVDFGLTDSEQFPIAGTTRSRLNITEPGERNGVAVKRGGDSRPDVLGFGSFAEGG